MSEGGNFKPGDWVRLISIPESVRPTLATLEDPDSTYSVLHRMLVSTWPRMIHEVDESGLLELMSYRSRRGEGRIYHYVLVEPECVVLTKPRDERTGHGE